MRSVADEEEIVVPTYEPFTERTLLDAERALLAQDPTLCLARPEWTKAAYAAEARWRKGLRERGRNFVPVTMDDGFIITHRLRAGRSEGQPT